MHTYTGGWHFLCHHMKKSLLYVGVKPVKYVHFLFAFFIVFFNGDVQVARVQRDGIITITFVLCYKAHLIYFVRE